MDWKTQVLTQHFTLGKLFKYVLPTVFAILLASVYGIVDGISVVFSELLATVMTVLFFKKYKKVYQF